MGNTHLLLLLYVIIEWSIIRGTVINPTNPQAQTCLRVCQILSNTYRNIQLFRYEQKTRIVFIFAGEELQIIVLPDGEWRYLS
ncbi:MAG: hypothetical protein WBM62_02465 [Crocosphaera sp.]